MGSIFKAYREWMCLLIKNFQTCVGLPVLDEVVDGERNALDGVLQVRVGNRRVVDVNGGTGARLFEGPELAHRPRLRELHLTSFSFESV